MKMTSAIASDLATLRSQLQMNSDEHANLLHLQPWRVLRDILLDWILVFGATALVFSAGVAWLPLVLLLIGNRQRALGNVLHDAGHGNLWRNRTLNDRLAQLLVAPFIFADLDRYRLTHFQHPARLGDAAADPDFLDRSGEPASDWLSAYARYVFSWKGWLGSMGGHLFDPEVNLFAKAYILVWWAGLLVVIGWLAGPDFVALFVVLWLVARGTVFHLITTFREMCDHYGLQPAGVFSFTRDVHTRGLLRHLIHPRNNGYHLTHHLLPAVPYYRLPEAHEWLQKSPIYRDRSTICSRYFKGADAVTRSWAAEGDR
jgi:fatty acid desaturase